MANLIDDTEVLTEDIFFDILNSGKDNWIQYDNNKYINRNGEPVIGNKKDG